MFIHQTEMLEAHYVDMLSVATAQANHHHSYWGIQGRGTQGNGCMDDDIYDPVDESKLIHIS